MAKEKDKPKVYSISVKCSNCDHIGTVEIPYGTPVSGKHECPNCGCMTASKNNTCSSLPWPDKPYIKTEPWDSPFIRTTWFNSQPKYPFDVSCELADPSKSCNLSS